MEIKKFEIGDKFLTTAINETSRSSYEILDIGENRFKRMETIFVEMELVDILTKEYVWKYDWPPSHRIIYIPTQVMKRIADKRRF